MPSGNIWFASVDLHDSRSLSGFFKPLRQYGQLEKSKVSLIMGTTYFQLIQAEISMQSFSWNQLQSHCHGEASRSSWSNVFDRNACNQSIRLLVEALEMRVNAENLSAKHVMDVFVRNNFRRYNCVLSYRLINGKWCYTRGHLLSSKACAQIVTTNDLALRINVNSRNLSSGKLLTDAKKYMILETPRLDAPDACAFGSSAELSADAI